MRFVSGVALIVATLAASSVHVFGVSPRLRLFTTTHRAMGTEFSLYLYSADSSKAAAISAEVFDEVDRVEDSLSNYRDSSELSRINRYAFAGPVTTDPEMLDFLRQSLYWSSASHGAFDITVGRLMKAWGFFRSNGRVPTAEELSQLRAVTGWQKVELDRSRRTVQFAAPGIELDPGGIGKGFAVDAAVRILRKEHVPRAMLSAGRSTIYALGAPPHNDGWRIMVPGIGPGVSELSNITLRDSSLSTANCTEKNFTVGAHVYCHIMDPHTMRPVEGRLQVSIIHPSATASDALSNVLFVDAPGESIRILGRYAPRARALIVWGDTIHPHCTSFRWNSSSASLHCTTPNRNRGPHEPS
jgi:thiamine biosynthesis lipoprotein